MTKLLDAWDLKILSAIEFDYRKSHQEIAKTIKRSKSFVTYRIKRLEEDNIISYRPLIDYSTLGFIYYRVIIECTLEKSELLKFIKKSVKTIWLVEKYDQENYVVVIAAKTFGEFQTLWEELYEQIAPFVFSKDISLAYRVHHLPLSFLTKTKRSFCFVSGASHPKDVVAEQIKLLDLLSENPLISNLQLSKKLKISINTVKKLIDDLEKKQVILAYQTLVNKELLDIKHYKLFLSFDFAQENKKRLLQVLKNNPYVVYITETSYHHDLECELFISNTDSFANILKDLKSNFTFRRVVVSQMKSEEKLF